MSKASVREDARLDVSRHAARLFIERGVANTTGDDIAAAARISTRTVWRYFGAKENCVEPLFLLSTVRFVTALRKWPRETSIEDMVHASYGPEKQSAQDTADDILAVLLLAKLPEEPALRAAWLMANSYGEPALIEIIADRLDRSINDFEVKLCAATVMAAIRIVDETVSLAAIKHGQKFTTDEINDHLAQTIRKASTLPICDPVAPKIWPTG